VKDGLTADISNFMIKDAKGFMWIASGQGELCRFDGSVFKKYIPNPQKPNEIHFNEILGFVEDSLNNIWIGTKFGLSRYDIKADSFSNFTTVVDSVNSNSSIIPFWSTNNEVYCLEAGLRVGRHELGVYEHQREWRKIVRRYLHLFLYKTVAERGGGCGNGMRVSLAGGQIGPANLPGGARFVGDRKRLRGQIFIGNYFFNYLAGDPAAAARSKGDNQFNGSGRESTLLLGSRKLSGRRHRSGCKGESNYQAGRISHDQNSFSRTSFR
jgi:hypothetical protein